MNRENLSYVDSLKGWAMLGVILTHSKAVYFPGILGKMGIAGARGVQMFFLISAYLTAMSLDRTFEKETQWNWRISFKWILKRLIRIVPLYYLMLAVYLIFIAKCGGGGINIRRYPGYFFF